MTQRRISRKVYPSSKRKAKGFLPAGGLIAQQMSTAHARRGYVQARLKVLWHDIVGAELATMCTPEKLTPARGPSGGLLKVAVLGCFAPQVQMMIPTIRDRVNSALGPGTVGRIQLVQSTQVSAPQVAPQSPSRPSRPVELPSPVQDSLSSIGDRELRDALQTLARNVISRRQSVDLRKRNP